MCGPLGGLYGKIELIWWHCTRISFSTYGLLFKERNFIQERLKLETAWKSSPECMQQMSQHLKILCYRHYYFLKFPSDFKRKIVILRSSISWYASLLYSYLHLTSFRKQQWGTFFRKINVTTTVVSTPAECLAASRQSLRSEFDSARVVFDFRGR